MLTSNKCNLGAASAIALAPSVTLDHVRLCAVHCGTILRRQSVPRLKYLHKGTVYYPHKGILATQSLVPTSGQIPPESLHSFLAGFAFACHD